MSSQQRNLVASFSQLSFAESVAYKKIKLKTAKQEFDATWKT
jgi:hypothetical protein